MNKAQVWRVIPVAIFLVAVISLNTCSKFPLGNTTIWWIVQAVTLYVFWMAKKYYFDDENKQYMRVVRWYLLWNILSIVCGLFFARIYWDWKGLAGNSMSLLLPVVAYGATNDKIVQSIFYFYLKYALPLLLIMPFFFSTGAYGIFLVPVSFLLLFLPALTVKRKIEVLALAMLVMFVDASARSSVIKFAVPLLLYYFRQFIPLKIFELLRMLLMATPVVLFILGATGTFNVFNMSAYIKGDYVVVRKNAAGEEKKDDLKADTRTDLYKEVLQSAKKYNSWLIGRSPARGNDTELFAETMKAVTGKAERLGNEVGILNILTWTGTIGVMLYFFVFYQASYLAINQSQNAFSKVLGIFIAFRWVYAWVEDINNFTIGYVFLWIAMGLCFSRSFRGMSEKEARDWVRGIFTKQVRSGKL